MPENIPNVEKNRQTEREIFPNYKIKYRKDFEKNLMIPSRTTLKHKKIPAPFITFSF